MVQMIGVRASCDSHCCELSWMDPGFITRLAHLMYHVRLSDPIISIILVVYVGVYTYVIVYNIYEGVYCISLSGTSCWGIRDRDPLVRGILSSAEKRFEAMLPGTWSTSVRGTNMST